jgi:hypothetical protein
VRISDAMLSSQKRLRLKRLPRKPSDWQRLQSSQIIDLELLQTKKEIAQNLKVAKANKTIADVAGTDTTELDLEIEGFLKALRDDCVGNRNRSKLMRTR